MFLHRLPPNKPSVGHPERAQLAKLFAVEESHGVAPSGKKSSRLRRRDLRTVTNSFPRAKELFRVHKRQRKTRVCANILRREIRPSFVGAPFGLREVVSLPDCLQSYSAMTAGDVLRWAFVFGTSRAPPLQNRSVQLLFVYSNIRVCLKHRFFTKT